MTQVSRIADKHNAMIPAAGEDLKSIKTALSTSLYPGASESSVDMVLAYCRASGLDPMTKPVHIVPMWIAGKNGASGGMRDVVMPGIELYRTKAHRTGEYAGQDEAEFGPTLRQRVGTVELSFPEWCKVTVYRMLGGQKCAYSAKVYWLETYAEKGGKEKDDSPNAMWRKRAFGQLEKCTEALALRKGFPEAVGAQPTAEEMEGRVIDADFEPVTHKPTVSMPKAKAQAAIQAEPNAPQGEHDAATDSAAGLQEPAAMDGSGSGDEPVGIHLSESQKRVLMAQAKRAGVSEESLLRRYPSVHPGNLNDVLADLRDMAENTEG